MSDQDIGKKMVEEIELEYLLDAYELVTGQRLSKVHAGERPDFICKRPNGSCVGVELTKVMREPVSVFLDRISCHRDHMSAIETLDYIFETVGRKADKRSQGGELYPKNTILVLQVDGCPMSELTTWISDDLQPDFSSYGFAEIWVADYTGIEAFGDIELFGLHPLEWWGYHQRQNPHRKPYG